MTRPGDLTGLETFLANLANSVDFGQGFWQSMGNSYRRKGIEMNNVTHYVIETYSDGGVYSEEARTAARELRARLKRDLAAGRFVSSSTLGPILSTVCSWPRTLRR